MKVQITIEWESDVFDQPDGGPFIVECALQEEPQEVYRLYPARKEPIGVLAWCIREEFLQLYYARKQEMRQMKETVLHAAAAVAATKIPCATCGEPAINCKCGVAVGTTPPSIEEVASWFCNSAEVEQRLQGANFLVALYNRHDYEGDAQVVYEQGGKYFYVRDSHCSCDPMDFDPSEISMAEAIAAAEETGDERLAGSVDN